MVLWKWTDYDDFFRKYGPDVNPDSHAIWDQTCTWLEGLGVLVKKGLINPELVYEIMYGFITNFWEKHLSIITRFREQRGSKMFEDLELLYNQMKKLSEIYEKDATAKLPELMRARNKKTSDPLVR